MPLTRKESRKLIESLDERLHRFLAYFIAASTSQRCASLFLT